ncbi:MAG TPA: phage baseplate assembly protein V [Beijerinckiaceae bacterium]|nr:phage baseplate assembly protein V [Beijerinckiaceae bacterium]
MNLAAAFARPAGWLSTAHLAEVVSLDDPDSLNRVQVRLIAYAEADGQDLPLWARVVSPFAGSDRGAFFMPDVGDEVLVVFVQGDPRCPLVIGGVWNGANAAPASIDAGGNLVKRLRSKNGIQITLEDQQGQETLTLETPGGQAVTLKDGPGAVTIEDANGNSVKLETSGITLQASGTVKVQAAKIDVSAGMVTVDAAMAKFSGVVKCEVLQSTSVVSTSYTPGAGNMW